MACVSAGATEIRLAIYVQPRSARSRVAGLRGDRLKVQVAAPPVDGAANEAVIAVIAEWLDVPRRMVRIARGESGREKLLAIAAARPDEMVRRVAEKLASMPA